MLNGDGPAITQAEYNARIAEAREMHGPDTESFAETKVELPPEHDHWLDWLDFGI
jgi:hypothetical protein